MKIRLRNHAAFTMVEILVASGLLVLIVLAIYTSWSTILRSSRISLDVAAEVQRSRIALRAVEDALLTAQNFAENQRYYAFISDTKDENFHYLSLTSRLPPTYPGAGMFGDYTVRRVTFEVQPQSDGKQHLVLTQYPAQWLTNETWQPYPITLVRDLSLFILEFWDPQRAQWMAEFTATNALPKMMRVTIGWGHLKSQPSEPAEIVSRIIGLPSSIVPVDAQATRN